MKKFKWWWGVGAVIVLCAAVVGVRSCKITDDYSKLKGAYEQMRSAYDDAAKVAAAKIAEQETAVADLNKKILKSEQTVKDLHKSIANKDVELDKIRDTWGQLSTECQAKLHELDTKWSEKFTLAQEIIAEKGAIIADWASKYAAAVTIGETWKAQYEAEHRLRLAGETLLGKLETKYKVLKFTSSIKSVAILTAAGFVGYTLIRGK